MKVVSEGVATKEQAALLAANGCDTLQGYYFSRPIPYKKISDLLLNNGEL